MNGAGEGWQTTSHHRPGSAAGLVDIFCLGSSPQEMRSLPGL